MTASAATIRGVSRPPYAVAARQLLRDTLFAAARDEVQQRPWAEVTMADVAGAAGVSRQTLYKEFGSRDEFAAAFVIHEGERFLASVEQVVRANFDDPHAAIAGAFEAFLTAAGEDALVRILLSDDGTGGMLPLVTTQSTPVVQWATLRLAAVIREGWSQASEADTQLLAEALVRLAISYVTVPDGSPPETAAAVAQLLDPFVERALT